jgi:chromosome segregation and condensation protein ScpB
VPLHRGAVALRRDLDDLESEVRNRGVELVEVGDDLGLAVQRATSSAVACSVVDAILDTPSVAVLPV